MTQTNNCYRVLDAFAGAGGFSLGFQLTGCEIVGAIEKDAWAAETFSFNHPGATVVVKEIDSLSDAEILECFSDAWPNVIVGGPPCQGFSHCRPKEAGDPTDPRNSLFGEFIRLGSLFAPELLVMENVPNVLKARTASGQEVIGIIQRELESLHYNVYVNVLEAVHYGVPQIRRRLFVVASKQELHEAFPRPTHTQTAQTEMFAGKPLTPTLWDAISDLPNIASGQGAEQMEYPCAPKNDYQRELRRGSNGVFNHTAMKHSKRMIERFAAMKCGESVTDVPSHLKPLARNGNGVISGKAYDQNNRRMHPDRPCHTIPASFYANFVHPFANRNFTPREGARLQSFPDWYRFKGKPTVVSHKLLAREERWDEKFLCQYNQIGNAVPPLMAKALAANLINQLQEKSSTDVCTREQLDSEGGTSGEVQRSFVQAVSS